jgi:hypothetical protein
MPCTVLVFFVGATGTDSRNGVIVSCLTINIPYNNLSGASVCFYLRSGFWFSLVIVLVLFFGLIPSLFCLCLSLVRDTHLSRNPVK